MLKDLRYGRSCCRLILGLSSREPCRGLQTACINILCREPGVHSFLDIMEHWNPTSAEQLFSYLYIADLAAIMQTLNGEVSWINHKSYERPHGKTLVMGTYPLSQRTIHYCCGSDEAQQLGHIFSLYLIFHF